MRKKIIAGNWKMNKPLADGQSLALEVINLAIEEVPQDINLVMCVPAIHLASLDDLLKSTAHVHLGAQDMSEHASGAYTGDISAEMLKSVGVKFVILGHSERRAYHQESNELLAKKVKFALQNKLTPIFCCGESLATREADQHIDFVNEQIKESLSGLTADEMKKVVIAYEPIWAIGTGKTASAEQAQEMHKSIRAFLATQFDAGTAESISILYGGSMKPANAKELLAQPDVDGGLIGGASLVSRDFVDIALSY